MSTPNKRRIFSLEKKKEIIDAAEKEKNQRKLARDFKIPESSLRNILKDKAVILKAIANGKDGKRLRLTAGRNEELEEALLQWFKQIVILASLGAGICFILLSFCNCKQSVLAITLAVSAFGLSSGFIPGFNTSVVCIAPRYTASIASFSRLLGQIASVASPYMIGIVVVKGVREEWQIAFFIMAFVLISTGILFQFYGSATIQEWAKVKQNHASEALLEDCEKRINGSIIVLFEASTNNTLEKASDEGNV